MTKYALVTKRNVLVVAVCAAVSLSAMAGLPVDLAKGYGVAANSSHGEILTSGFPNQADCGRWAAVIWDTEQTIDKLVFGLTRGYVVAAYEIQVPVDGLGRPADPAVDSDWRKIYEYATDDYVNTGSRPHHIEFDQITTSAVRLVVLDKQNAGNDPNENARINGIWAWANYNNIADQATFSVEHGTDAWDWNGPASILNDGSMTQQTYKDPTSNPYMYARFDTAVTLDAFMVGSGSGRAVYEVLGGIKLEYWDDEKGEYVPVPGGAVVNNTGGVTDPAPVDGSLWWLSCEFEAVTAQYWRFEVTDIGNNSGGLARISEIMLFAPIVPEPATMCLLALGGLAMLRRRK